MSDARPPSQPDEAMVDLLIKQVTEGLSAAEQRALDVLDTEVASTYSRDLERAAAAVTLAGSAASQPLPATLAQRLAQQAQVHFHSGKILDLGAARVAAAEAARTPAGSGGIGRYGWLAAAACLVLAVFGWVRSPAPAPLPPPVVEVVIPPPKIIPRPEKPKPPTATEERAAMLAKADTLKITLAPTKDPAAAGVTADAVWDPETQRGFLHFTGLAANDPAVHQYQMWIFDATRDKRYPVDGGVFDVPADGGEVVIPIRASLMVHKPAAFAVTVEKPGGVVVSDRAHLVALGAVT